MTKGTDGARSFALVLDGCAPAAYIGQPGRKLVLGVQVRDHRTGSHGMAVVHDHRSKPVVRDHREPPIDVCVSGLFGHG